MRTLLIIAGIVGVLVSVANLYGALRFYSKRWEGAISLPVIWDAVTFPIVSTLLLFTLKHFIYCIAIAISVIHFLSTNIGILVKSRSGHTISSLPAHYLTYYGGRSLLIVGTAVVLIQKTQIAALASWYLPSFILGCWIASVISNYVFAYVMRAVQSR